MSEITHRILTQRAKKKKTEQNEERILYSFYKQTLSWTSSSSIIFIYSFCYCHYCYLPFSGFCSSSIPAYLDRWQIKPTGPRSSMLSQSFARWRCLDAQQCHTPARQMTPMCRKRSMEMADRQCFSNEWFRPKYLWIESAAVSILCQRENSVKICSLPEPKMASQPAGTGQR